jgi:hypothetical protein
MYRTLDLNSKAAKNSVTCKLRGGCEVLMYGSVQQVPVPLK